MDTRERQCKMWSDVLLEYAKSKGVYSMSLQELYASEICHNTKINRRLSIEGLKTVLAWMQKQ